MSSWQVMVTDHVFRDPSMPAARRILEDAGAEVTILQCLDEEELRKRLSDADAIITEYAYITRRIIENLKRCRIIARLGIGYDSVDIRAATERGICVANVPSYCEDEVAEHALALIFACARKVVALNTNVKRGEWDFKLALPIHRLKAKVLGLVGFGKIAKLLAEKAKALGLEVIAYTRSPSEDVARQYGVRFVGFEELLRKSDFISIHVPLTEETRNMFQEEQFRLMKPTAFIINTARGRIIDEAALNRALDEGWIAGAALDVMVEEPADPANPLLARENVIVTPHAAWYSEDSAVALQTKVAEEVARVLRGELPRSLVNPEVKGRVWWLEGCRRCRPSSPDTSGSCSPHL